MNNIKEWILDNITIVYAAIMIALFVVLLMSDPKPEPPPLVQEYTLEDGTKCVVLKGIYSDNAITCNWSK
jgi:hypothetical protein